MKRVLSDTNDIMLSIVMPAYNAERFISKCIDSVISQNDLNYELIIIDDGSTDSTGEICNYYSAIDHRIRVLTQTNAGSAAARRKGILDSKGKYILNIDSDDYLIKGGLKLLQNHLINDEYDVIQFSHYEIFNRFKFKKRVHEYVASRDGVFESKIVDLLGGWNRMITPNVWDKVYRANILRSVMNLIDENISIGEDILINLHFLSDEAFSRMKSVDEAFYVYRKDIGIMSSTNWKDLKDYNILKLYQDRFIKQYKLSENERFHCHWEVVGIIRYAVITLLKSEYDKTIIKDTVDGFFKMAFVLNARTYLRTLDNLPVSDVEKRYIEDFCTLDIDAYILKLKEQFIKESIMISVMKKIKVVVKRII